MTPERLAQLSNGIAAFFAAYPREQAVAEVKRHIERFWEPRMRRQLLDHVANGGAGLHPLVVAAFRTERDTARGD